MGLLDSVIGGVLGQVLGGGRGGQGSGQGDGHGGSQAGGAMSPIVKALLMLLLAKGASGGLGDIFGGGQHRPGPGADRPSGRDLDDADRDPGDLGGFNRRGGGGEAPASLPGGDYSDLSGMLDGPGERHDGPIAGNVSHETSGGFDGLVDSFRRGGLGDVIESWIGHGPNRAVAPDQLGQALGPGALDTLQSQTGLGREELLGQLAQILPEVVSKLTPDGRVPDAAERRHW